jgi:dolichol-phosphate mannosyltransferase
MRIIVVVPTYNEAGNIAQVLRRLRKTVPAADILVVDDASPDGTAEIARASAAELGGIGVLIRAGKLGLGSAYRDAFIEGLRRGYQVLVEMDGDLSHDAAALPDLLRAVEGGADLAVGSRYVPGGSIPHWSASRRALSRWGNRYARWVLALPLADATSGFRAYRAGVVARIDLPSVRADGYGFQIEMAYRVARAGGTIAEVPIEFIDRERGRSKMSVRIIVEALLLVTWWGVRDLAGRRRGSRHPASVQSRSWLTAWRRWKPEPPEA